MTDILRLFPVTEFEEVQRNDIKDSLIIFPVRQLFTEISAVTKLPALNTGNAFVFGHLDICFNKLATFEERLKLAFRNNVAYKDQTRQTLFSYTVSYEKSENNAITLFHYYVDHNISLRDIHASIQPIISARFYKLAKLILDSCNMIIPSSDSTQYSLLRDDVPDDILSTLILKGFFNHCQENKVKEFVAYDVRNNIFMHLALRNKQKMIIDSIDYQISECNQDKGIVNIDLNYKNKNGYNLLHVAIQNGCDDLIRKLMTTLPSTSFTEQIHGFDSIHYAAFVNKESVLCLLIEYFHNNHLKINSFQPGYCTHGLNIKRCATKKTPLMYAIEHKMINAIHKIGELYPASMNTVAAYGDYHVSPVMVAYAKKDATIFNLLLKHGANSDGIDVQSMIYLDIIDWVNVNANELVLKNYHWSDIEFKDGKAIISSKYKPEEDSPERDKRSENLSIDIDKINGEYNWYRRKDFIEILDEGCFLESAQHRHIDSEHTCSNSNLEKILCIKGVQECITKYI